MRIFAKVLCLSLFVVVASCSASSMPTVRDYTSRNPKHNVKPQSVIGLCPPSEPTASVAEVVAVAAAARMTHFSTYTARATQAAQTPRHILSDSQ